MVIPRFIAPRAVIAPHPDRVADLMPADGVAQELVQIQAVAIVLAAEQKIGISIDERQIDPAGVERFIALRELHNLRRSGRRLSATKYERNQAENQGNG